MNPALTITRPRSGALLDETHTASAPTATKPIGETMAYRPSSSARGSSGRKVGHVTPFSIFAWPEMGITAPESSTLAAPYAQSGSAPTAIHPRARFDGRSHHTS